MEGGRVGIARSGRGGERLGIDRKGVWWERGESEDRQEE